MIVRMTPEHAASVSGWAYPGEYAIYSFTPDAETLRELTGGTYFARLGESEELTGYFCFGASAQIPTPEEGAYDAPFFDVGLGLRPDLCGHGDGAAFLLEGLEFARNRFGVVRFRLTVARFNVRAQRAYEKAGFAFVRQVTHRNTGTLFYIMTKEDAR